MKIKSLIVHTTYHTKSYFIAFLSLLIVLSGCRRKQTKPTPQMGIEPQFWVRVLLLEDINSCSLKLPSSFAVISPDAKIKKAHFEKPDSAVNIEINAGKINFSGWLLAANQITITPEEPYIFKLNGNNFRGNLELIPHPDANCFDMVNVVPIDSYLAGVIGAEMPNYWEPEALQAQTIAARTYCIYTKKRFGKDRYWDVRKTQANQVYRGLKVESSQIWDAINKTIGMVLFCRYPDGTEDVFPAYYSSSCGGHTEDSLNVFGESFVPLKGVFCPYCRKIAKQGFYNWSEIEISKKEVHSRLLERYPNLKKLGEIAKIEPYHLSKYKDFSRITSLKIIGSTGKSDSLRAEDFRLAIDPTGLKIKSASFEIKDSGDKLIFTSGRGFGHGVGLCQCGAQALARKGKKAEQILFYYYQKPKIKKIY